MFASYAHADRHSVASEIAEIESLITVWLDDGIRPGHRWNDELASAIVGCSAFVLFVTPNSVVSANCLRELQFAIDEDKTLVAIHLQPTQLPDGLRLALGDTQAILRHELPAQRYRQLLRSTFAPLRTDPTSVPAPATPGVVTDRPSMAVLPFQALTRDSETEAFANGMTEDVTILLSRVPEFFVVGCQSAAALAAGMRDYGELARRLRVRYLIAGSVRMARSRLRVSAQLIDADPGATLWANSFDRDLDDVFELQDELARSIAGQLRPELVIADLNYGRVTRRYTSWRRIADAMVKFGHSPSPQHIDDLVALVEETLRLDPDYGPAHALYAFTVARRRNWGEVDAADIERCERAARRALEIAPQDPTVLFFVAGVEQALGRRRNGERLAILAADREPSNAAFQASAGFILTLGGTLAPGIERLRLAVRLSPNDPLRGQYLFQLGAALFLAGEFSEASDVLNESLRLQPESTWAWLILAGASHHLGDDPTTEHAIGRIKALSGWGVEQFRVLLERILADSWKEHTTSRQLWEETLQALARRGL